MYDLAFLASCDTQVIDAYAVMDDADALAEKVQNFFAQAVVGATYDALLVYLEDVSHLSVDSF